MNLAGFTQQGTGYNNVYVNLSPTLNFSGSFSDLVANTVQANTITYVDLSTNIVTNINQAVNNLSSNILSLSSTDINLSGGITTLSSNIITLSLSVTNLSSNIISLSSTDINLSGRISTLSSALYPIANQITINTNNTTLNNAKLIIKNSSGHPELQLQGSTTAWGIISLNDNNLSAKARIFAGQGTNIVNFDNTMGGYLFSQNSLERMKLDANGNLSLIGTLSSSTINSLSSNIITLSNTTSNLSSNVFITLSSNIVSLSSNIVTLSSLGIGGSQSLSGNIQSLSTYLFKSGMIAKCVYLGNNLGQTLAQTTFSSSLTGWGTVYSYTFTPSLVLSNVEIFFHASYQVSNYGGDTWLSRITVNGLEVVQYTQVWNNSAGGGTRSVPLTPLYCTYYKDDSLNLFGGVAQPKNVVINIQVYRYSSDDGISFNGNFSMKVAEIYP